jgi:adenylate cyclase
MAQEIERKFLVRGPFRDQVQRSTRIVQGYLSSVPERTVRVRVKGDKGYLTIKGIGSGSGASRFEWEREIPPAEAEELLALCEPGVIDKVRHLVKAGDHTYEVDEFYGENAGLVVAEIELDAEDEAFHRPVWLGQEVTGDTRYYNSMLMKQPYTRWPKDTA